MKSVTVTFVKQSNMRYDTLDDYVVVGNDNQDLVVQIADTGDKDSNLALLIHALIEYRVAQKHGITVEQIDQWDFSHAKSPEPAEEPGCPYGEAHQCAMTMEKCAVQTLGIEWVQHEKNLEECING